MPGPDLLLPRPMISQTIAALEREFTVHKLWEAEDAAALQAEVADRVRFLAAGAHAVVDEPLLRALPRLEIVANFGVGYDSIDAAGAARHGVVVTNTPDVLNEEVADLAMGLLIATVREIPQSDKYLREGKWPSSHYPLTQGTLRGRTLGIVGLGRIGKAIAKRAEAFGLSIAYYGRRKQADVAYLHYPTVLALAQAVDTLMIIVPGGAETRNLIDSEVLKALGPSGILINVARGTVVDEEALIDALAAKQILGAGLDVFADEPNVPARLLGLDNVVLLPHIGSASVHTRIAMGQLVVDNLVSWRDGKGPVTPVHETPWPRK
jgi:lactate dehydrogenase-like 2-hydroxyacid dehydrogenase